MRQESNATKIDTGTLFKNKKEFDKPRKVFVKEIRQIQIEIYLCIELTVY